MPTGPEGSLAIQAGPGAAAPWADAAQVSLLACWTLQSSNRTDLKNSVRCEPVGRSGRRSALEQNQVKVREGVGPRGQSRPPDTAQEGRGHICLFLCAVSFAEKQNLPLRERVPGEPGKPRRACSGGSPRSTGHPEARCPLSHCPRTPQGLHPGDAQGPRGAAAAAEAAEGPGNRRGHQRHLPHAVRARSAPCPPQGGSAEAPRPGDPIHPQVPEWHHRADGEILQQPERAVLPRGGLAPQHSPGVGAGGPAAGRAAPRYHAATWPSLPSGHGGKVGGQ